MSTFQKWIVYSVFMPLGAVTWVAAGMAVSILFERIKEFIL